jgi:glycolate oxidase
VRAAGGAGQAGAGEAGAAGAGRLVEALSRVLPGDRIVADPEILAAMSHDEAEWAPAGRAAAGVRAR